MGKILIIDDCQDCKWFGHEYPWWLEKCKKLDRKIERDPKGASDYPIPSDCPLDDAPSP